MVYTRYSNLCGMAVDTKYGEWLYVHAHVCSYIIHHVMFRYQYQVLTRNPVVTEANRNLLVETFRSIAEILIWGDQNDSRVFE